MLIDFLVHDSIKFFMTRIYKIEKTRVNVVLDLMCLGNNSNLHGPFRLKDFCSSAKSYIHMSYRTIQYISSFHSSFSTFVACNNIFRFIQAGKNACFGDKREMDIKFSLL